MSTYERVIPEGDSTLRDIEGIRARGVRLWVAGGRLRASPRRLLTISDKDLLRDGEPAIVAALRHLPTTSAVEPEPFVWTRDYSRRITQADVADTLGSATPDELSKQAAYEHARDVLAKRAHEARMKDANLAMRRNYATYEGE